MKNFLKNKMLKRSLLGLSLALVMIGGVFIYQAMAAVTTVTITSPTNGTKTYNNPGDTVTVTFNVVTDAIGDGTLRVEIYKGATVIGDTTTYAHTFAINGANNGITASVPISMGAADNSYDVKVTAQQPGGGTVITGTETDAVVIDNTNPATPTILTPTASGLYLKGGSTYAITWTPTSDTNLGATPIKIEYSPLGTFGDTEVLTAGTANDGTYDWTVPASDLATAKIRITATDLAGNTAVSASANAFTIDNTAPAILATTLLTPSAAGIKLQGGATYAVTWTTGDITDTNLGATPISIEYSPAGTFADTVVATSSIANSGAYSWTVPASNLATAKIRVKATDLAGNTSVDPSDNAFLIDSTNPTVSAGTFANPINTATAPGATASDGGAGIATYAWTSASGTVIFSNAAIVNPNLSAATDGDYVALLTVTDSAGNIGTSTVAFTWDVTPPVLSTSIVGSTIQAANDTITLNFDGPVQPQDGTWSANDIEYIKSPATSSAFTLTNATFSPTSGATTTLTITLNEATDNMFLRNGNIIVVKPASNKIQDAAGNFVANTDVTGTVANSGDAVQPSVTLTYSPDRTVTPFETIRITATFSEAAYETTVPTIAIATPGDGDLAATNMTKTSSTVWYYDWSVPGNTDEQGTATVTIAATDLAGNANTVASNNTRTIDSIAPIVNTFTATSITATGALLTVTTNEAATCAYADTEKNYASMTAMTTTTGVTTHLQTLSGLTANTTYNYYVRCADASSNTMVASAHVGFTTLGSDLEGPTISSQTPTDNATGTAVTVSPTLTFSEALNAATVNAATIQLRTYASSTPVSATVQYNSDTYVVTIDPVANLDANAQYYIWVSGVKDAANNALTTDYSASAKASHEFTTAAAANGTLAVSSITPVRTYATSGGGFDAGWSWTFNVTVPTTEASTTMKFANWVSGSNSIAALNNIRFYSAQSSNAYSTSTAITISGADTYSSVMTINGDLDASTAGKQIQITVEAQVPADQAGGSYSTSYGIQSN